MASLKDFVVVATHSPELCPHSNAATRKIYEGLTASEPIAEKLEIETVFRGIPVPEHQTIMILRAPTFEAVRTFTVVTHLVQVNTITIRQTESFEEFWEESKDSTPLW